MKNLILFASIFFANLLSAQIIVVNHKNETVNNVEVLQKSELITLSNSKGEIPALIEDSSYVLFHPNYAINEFVFKRQDTINIGKPILLFSNIDVNEKETDLYQRIYDSTYANFVKQEIALMGELWIYQKMITSKNGENDTVLNIIKANVAYEKHEKSKKETWSVKGEPQRMFQQGDKRLSQDEFEKVDFNLNKTLPQPDILSSFFKRKTFLSAVDHYKVDHLYSSVATKIKLNDTTDRGFVNNIDLEYTNTNYLLNEYSTNNVTPKEGITVMNYTLQRPLNYHYRKFVHKDGYYYPQTMLFNYCYVTKVRNVDLTAISQLECAYIFRVKDVVPQSELPKEYEKKKFSNSKYIRSIPPSKEVLKFPYYIQLQ